MTVSSWIPSCVVVAVLVLLGVPQVATATIYGDIAHVWAFNDTVSIAPWETASRNFSYDTRGASNYSINDAGHRALIVNQSKSPFNNESFITDNSENERVMLLGNRTGATEPLSYIQAGRLFEGRSYNFTVELWYRYAHGENDTLSQTNSPIWGQDDGGGPALTRNVTQKGIGATVRFCFSWKMPRFGGYKDYQLCTGNNGSYNQAAFNTSWLHLAVTSNTGDGTGFGWVSLLVNGSNDTNWHGDFGGGPTSNSMQPANYSGTGTALYFGITNGPGGTVAPHAYYDEIRIWNITRSAANISALKATSFIVAEAANQDVSNVTFCFRDEDSGQTINQTNLTIFFSNTNLSKNVTYRNPYCQNITDLHTGNFQLTVGQYVNRSEWYPFRTRIFDLNLSNFETNIYLVNSTGSPLPTQVRVTREDNRALFNYTITSQRRFSQGWSSVEDARTDEQGRTWMRFNTEDDVYYRFLLYQNGTLVGFLPERVIGDGPIELTFRLTEDPLANLRRMGNLSTALITTGANESGNVSFIWSDPQGDVRESIFLVARITTNGSVTVCNSTTGAAVTGWLNCTTPNVTGAEYVAYGCIYTNDTRMGAATNQGMWGLFFFIIVLCAFVGALIWSGTGALLGLCVAVMVGSLSHLISVLYGVVAFFALLVLVAVFMGRN